MGPIEMALVAGTPAATMLAKDLLFKILGPSAEYLGEKLKGNLVAVAGRAQTMMEEADIEPAHVHPRIGVPLLESARLEDDEDMQERWAALLANAANLNGEVEVKPTFVEILKQLSASEAKLLDVIIFEACSHMPQDTVRAKLYASSAVEFWLEDLYRLTSWSSPASSLALALTILASHGLVERQRRLGMESRGQLTTRNEEDLAFFREHEFSYHLTPLGYEFVTACRRPKRKEGG